MANPRIAWEFKFTSDMDYITKHGLGLQLGVYFLGNPTLQRIVVRVLKFPDLQYRKNEIQQDYLERTHNQIKKFPGAYIKDMVFWREEFDLQEIRDEVRRIQQDILTYRDEGQSGYYKNRMACSVPYPCSFLPLCELGLKDWKDSPITEGLYKPRGERNVQSDVHNMREQRNWENDLSI